MASQIQVIDRAVALLRALGVQPVPRRLTDLASETGLTPSTARRILASLVANGMCEQAGQGLYRLGLTVFALGRQAESGMDLRERSRTFLARLAAETKLTSMLGVRYDMRAVCLERVDGFYATTLALTVGTSLPLHAGGVSKALLYFSGDQAVHEYVAHAAPLRRYTDKTLISKAEVLKDAAETRHRGWVETIEDVTPGVAALAVPLYGAANGAPVGAISISGLIPHVIGETREANIAALQAAGNDFSTSLGWMPDQSSHSSTG